MKRIVSIQDISCIGKCSLTVALPIISAMGVETAVLPTAVLSTHTAIRGFTFHNLTQEMLPVAKHWRHERYTFDAIYTGYLGSFEQLEIVSEFIDTFQQFCDPITGEKRSSCIFIDPVLGDYGRLYAGFTPDFAQKMRQLCARADVIVPNMTEACAMLEMDYLPEGEYTEAQVKDILRRLCDLGTKNAILTGASFLKNRVGFVGFNAKSDTFFSYMTERIPQSFHGTGDIFASATVGALMNEISLHESLCIAADYTLECINETLHDPSARAYGVNFESAIPYLIKRISR